MSGALAPRRYRRRAPSFAVKKVRRERGEFLREHGWSLAGVGALVGAAVSFMVVEHPGFASGVVAGAGLASLGWGLYLVIAVRSYSAYIGAKAERWTTKMLKSAPPNWICVPNVPFENYDVDHVVLTADAVLAIEVKWRPQLSVKDSRSRHSSDLAQANKSANKMRSFLRSQKMTDLTVIPTLLLWGPGTPEMPGGRSIEGDVHVLDGNRFNEWKYAYTTGHRLFASVDALSDALTRYVRARDDYKAPTSTGGARGHG